MKLIHQPTAPWLFVSEPDTFTLRLWSAPGCVARAEILYGDPYDYAPGEGKQNRLSRLPMEPLWENEEKTVWTARVPVPTHKLRYFFECVLSDGGVGWLGENGLRDDPAEIDAFRTGSRFETDRLPSWTGRSIWYQIFPERFAGGKVPPEEFRPTPENRWGGTLEGIREKAPYLRSLGVTGVYLNPVFSSPSNHRYDTLDYTRVDEALGDNDALTRLAETLHENGLRLMLDGVFNHVSRQCAQFQDVLEKGEASRYRDWFTLHDMESVRALSQEELTAQRMKDDPPYECFAYASNMVKWNTENEEAQEYLIGCAEKWTRILQLDAWRLDVADEVSPAFLRKFRRRMRSLNPELLLIGEIWVDPSPWVQGGLFDGTMNYSLYRAVLRYLLRGEIRAEEFCRMMEECVHTLPPEIARQQMNFIGNHDLARPLTEAKGSLAAVQAAWLLLCLLDGEANLYYGDERAMTGGDDPANRGAMRWEDTPEALETIDFVRKTAELRRTLLNRPLRSVHFRCLKPEWALMEMEREGTRIRLALANENLAGIPGEWGRPDFAGERFALWTETAEGERD